MFMSELQLFTDMKYLVASRQNWNLQTWSIRSGQGLPSDLTNDSLCLHLVEGLWDDPAQDSMPRACRCELDALKYPILSVLRKETDFLQTQWVRCMALPHM